MTDNAHLHRLGTSILADDSGLTLVAGLPGTGKTELLKWLAARTGAVLQSQLPTGAVLGLVLVDLPRDARISLAGMPRMPRLVIAGRPEQFADLARTAMEGDVRVIGNAELFLPSQARPARERSAGWPVLAAHFDRDPDAEDTAIGYLRQTLATLPKATHAALLAVLRAGTGGLRDPDMPGPARRALVALSPLVARKNGVWRLATRGVAGLLRAALDEPRAALPPDALDWLERAAPPVAAIQELLGAGQTARALALFHAHGGMFLSHLHGMDSAGKVLAAFDGTDPRDPHLTGLAFMLAAKGGHTERAAHLLARGGGPEIADTGHALRLPGKVPPQLLLCRLLLAIYRNTSGASFLLTEAAGVLARIGEDDHLLRGGIYNVVLDLHIRSGALAVAEETATRALHHYERGDAPYLSFFIHVHRAVIHLTAGDPGRAQRPLEAAKRSLDATPFETGRDQAFLSLLRAVVAYERGEPEPMVEFAEHVFERFAYGEMWASIAAQAMAHGADALLQLRGATLALRYLDGWRVQAWRTRRFRVLIEQREVTVLQAARRWREARVQLEAMATRIGRVWMDSSGENLADLRDPEDISQALLWLRQQAFERPRDAALPPRIEAFALNPRLSWRDRMRLRLWLTWARRRQGRVATARDLLAGLLADCDARRCTAPVLEERLFVLPMLEDKRMMQGRLAAAPLPRNLRRGAARAYGTGPLSRQEWRALLLLSEGCSNKQIAREMGLSLPTVKFHLKNLYAKLGVSERRAAVEMARRHQMVAV